MKASKGKKIIVCLYLFKKNKTKTKERQREKQKHKKSDRRSYVAKGEPNTGKKRDNELRHCERDRERSQAWKK